MSIYIYINIYKYIYIERESWLNRIFFLSYLIFCERVYVNPSRQLKLYECNYPIHNLELAAIIFALKI